MLKNNLRTHIETYLRVGKKALNRERERKQFKPRQQQQKDLKRDFKIYSQLFEYKKVYMSIKICSEYCTLESATLTHSTRIS